MTETLDQIFVTLKHWLVELCARASGSRLSRRCISVAAIIGVFATLFAITTVLERKGLGRIQNRYGPNRVGPFGFLQPVADGIKALTKEDIVPRAADKVVHFLAPLVLVVPAFLALPVLPMGRNMVADRSGRGRAVLLRRRRGDRTVGVHGRMVEPQQIFAARRDARHRADDQLRNAADSLRGHA